MRNVRMGIFKPLIMNVIKIKKRWVVSRNILVIAGIFWALETFYFIKMYGFHWTAINEAEKMCDEIVSLLVVISIIIWFNIVNEMVKRWINQL